MKYLSFFALIFGLSQTLWAQSLPEVDPADSIQINFSEETQFSGNVIVIPEEEFHRLLETNNFKAVGPNGQKKAVKITTKLNSPVAVGIVADLSVNPVSKSRTKVIIVAREAKSLGGDYVEVTDYYVVSVKFRNVTFQSWSGSNVRMKMSGFGKVYAECCEDSAPKCWEDTTGPEACPTGPLLQCIDYSTLPEGYVNELDSEPGSSWIANDPVSLTTYPDRSAIDNGSGTPIPDIPVKPKVCEKCKLIQCGEPGFDPTNSPLNPSDAACGIGNDDDEICHYFRPGVEIDASCDDRWTDMRELNRCTGVAGPGAIEREFSQLTKGLLDKGTLPECENGLPEICKYLSPGDDTNRCDPDDAAAQEAFLDMMGCGLGGSVTQGSSDWVCCEGVENCACKTDSSGKKTCLSCNKDGVCQSVETESTVDPRVISIPIDEHTNGENPVGKDEDPAPGEDGYEEDKDEELDPEDPDEDDEEPDDEEEPPSNGGGAGPKIKDSLNNEPSADKPPDDGFPGGFGGADHDEFEAGNSDIPAQQVLSELHNNNNGQTNRSGKQLTQGAEGADGDPVALVNGAMLANVIDLSFPGIKSPLSFARAYDSRSQNRGILGSNWTHNWEVRLEPLKPKTAPSWASPYCKQWYPQATCLMYHDGYGNQSLYIWDPGDQIFKPQAGRFDHIKSLSTGGYLLASVNGDLRRFDEYGYLTRDTDRFGNWKSVQYEATPAFLLYRRYCFREVEEAKVDSEDFWRNDNSFDPRLCEMLSHMFNDQAPSDLNKDGWNKPNIDPNHEPFSLPGDSVFAAKPKSYEGLGTLGGLDAILYNQRLKSARIYIAKIFRTGYFPELPTGSIRFRPIIVRDNLGRSLQFNYNNQNTPIDQSPHVDFGLLESVTGPTDIHVNYSYDRPSTSGPFAFPTRLNESFLVKVERGGATFPDASNTNRGIDNSQWANREGFGESRTYEYIYQWPQIFGPAIPSWEDHHALLRRKWKSYLGIFIGCKTLEEVSCPGGQNSARGGNPCMEAEFIRQNYISTIADNILSVERNGRLELFSEYDANPAGAYDRVTTQRYGGEFSLGGNAYTRSLNLPSFDFEYISAGPLGPFDNTTQFLPAEILSRYPLEIDASLPKENIDCEEDENASCFTLAEPAIDPNEIDDRTACVWDKLKQTKTEACSPSQLKARQREIPGYRATLKYFPSPGFIDFQEHNRSRLTCSQLARAAIGDPFHNDLTSVLVPIAATPNKRDNTIELVTGHRLRVAADANRICAWTKTEDRSGTVKYRGLNFRGQEIVNAVQTDSGAFVFVDTFVNADGNIIEVRLPQRGVNQRAYNGKTLYLYEDIDGNANDGWNAYLPAFWGKRSNLISTIEVPKFLTYEADVNDYSSSKTTDFTYEPLFNQLQTITESKQLLSGGDTPIYRIRNEFDYQEFAGFPDSTIEPDATKNDAGAIAATLFNQRRYGKDWSFDGSAGVARMDNRDELLSWQFSANLAGEFPLRAKMKFYDKDLNGDGIRGFVDGDRVDSRRAKALPVRVIFEDLTQRSDDRLTLISWAPNGLPAGVLQPNGKLTSFDYYKRSSASTTFEDAFGKITEPIDADISQGYGGLLAKISWNEYDDNYPTDLGPPRLIFGGGACEALKGPYQWIIRACDVGTFNDLLTGLNIPPTTIEDLERTQESPKKSISMSYTSHAYPFHVWENGRISEAAYDSDGRMVSHVDARGNTSTFAFTIDGWPESEVAKGPGNSSQVYKAKRMLDNEGRVISECTALVHGACDPIFDFLLPTPGDPSPAGTQVEHFTYRDDGMLESAFDPEGTQTTYQYDMRKRVVEIRVLGNGTEENRRVAMSYDDRHRLTERVFGTLNTQKETGRLLETFAYDDYSRLTSYQDHRGTDWQFAYGRSDEQVAQRQSSIPYDSFDMSQPSYFINTVFNGHSEPISEDQHGLTSTQWNRYPDGRIASITTTGGGETYLSFDTDGRMVWQEHQYGDETIQVTNPGTAGQNPRTSEVIIGRKSDFFQASSLDFLTRTYFTEFNKNYEVTSEATFANDGKVQTQGYVRTPLGYVSEFTNREGFTTIFRNNLLGWVTQTEVPKRGGGVAISRFEFNSRGQNIKIIDPSGQITTNGFNLFGELENETRPGSPGLYLDVKYDGLGRISRRTNALTEIVDFEYDRLTGDPIREIWINSPVDSTPLLERTFDILGRIDSETNFNVGLSTIAQMPTQTITSNFTYDPLGRLLQEVRLNGFQQSTVDFSFTPSSNGWSRTMTYPSGDTLIEQSDQLGRIVNSQTQHNGATRLHEHKYVGDIYTGKDSHWDLSGIADPMQFSKSLDGFGRPIDWSVNALSFTGTNPSNSAWADGYCGGVYDSARCSKPLFNISGVRDVMGRLRSVKTRFSHPMDDNGTPLPDSLHQDRWRAYTYSPRGFLTTAWEKDGLGVDDDSLILNAISNSDIIALGNNISADRWAHIRDATVGSLEKIENAQTLETRWESTMTRAAGHRLTEISLDSTTYAIEHDAAGRTTQSLDFQLRWDALDNLVGIFNPAGAPIELYAYDAQGNLSFVYDVNNQTSGAFSYDGDRMIQSVNDADTLLWTLFRGPDGVDDFLEFHTSDFPILPIADHRKSVVGAWDMVQRKVIETGTYDASGRLALYSNDEALLCNEVGNPGVICNAPGYLPFGFNGRWRSNISGFTNMSARWYSPRMGEFLSQDPLRYVDLYNLYGFGAYDSVNRFDPSGQGATAYVPPPTVKTKSRLPHLPNLGPLSRGLDKSMETIMDPNASMVDRAKAQLFIEWLWKLARIEEYIRQQLNTPYRIDIAAQKAGGHAARALVNIQNDDDLSTAEDIAKALKAALEALGDSLEVVTGAKKPKKPKMKKKDRRKRDKARNRKPNAQKKGNPGPNRDQNRQFRQAGKAGGLKSKDELDKLHQHVTGQNYSFQEMVEIAKQIKNGDLY